MNILVLGTSNSILLNGWVWGLRAALPSDQIETYCFGASPGLQFASQMSRDFTQYDFVLLDSMPNDQEMSENLGRETYVDRVMFEIFSTIAAQTNLVLVAFCNKFHLPAESPVLRRQRALARALGVQLLDIRQLVLEFGDRLKGDHPDCYEEHPSHPLRHIAFEFGHRLGQMLEAQPRERFAPAQNAADFSGHFSHWIAAGHVAPERLATRKSSLVTEQIAVLQEGDRVEFPQEQRCIGFYSDILQLSAIAVLHAANGTSLGIMAFQYREGDGYGKFFLPVINGFATKSLTIAAESSGEVIRSRFSHHERPADVPIQFPCASAVFWSGDEHQPWHAAPPPGFDDWLTNAVLKSFRAEATLTGG
jgi:hypothetical protein